jgi:sporulation delaying protein A
MPAASGDDGGDDGPRHEFDGSQQARCWRSLGAWALAFASPWIALVLYSLQAALPSNPLNLPAQRPLLGYGRQLLPEGWAFFTRDPREADVLLFRRAGDGWERAEVGSYAQAKFAFGWSRRPRAQGLELALLLASTTKEDWRPCTAISDCLAASRAEPISIPDRSPVPTLCGQVALVKANPVPWAWARHVGADHRAESVVFLSVQC